MKVLIYAGCHGKILKDYIDLGEDFQVEYIQNWALVQSGLPFPYESLSGCDLFVYSPVRNKPGYNTQEIIECAELTNQSLFPFPWLQWNAYFPNYNHYGNAQQGFSDRYNWWHSGHLLDLAKASTSYHDFKRLALADDLYDRDHIFSIAEKSLGRIYEDEYEIALKVNNYIGHHGYSTRLFSIPDHPSNLVYRSIFDALDRKVGTTRSLPQEEYVSLSVAYHADAYLPLLPSVCKAFDFNPDDNNLFRNNWKFQNDLGIEDFLLLHYDFPTFERHCIK